MSEFLRCDAEGCDHFEQTAITAAVVDKPCPKCGANLCTAEDFVVFKAIAAATRAATDLTVKANPDTPLTLMAVNVRNGVLHTKKIESMERDPWRNEKAE